MHYREISRRPLAMAMRSHHATRLVGSRNRRKAFTLLEVMLVLVIIAAIAGIAVVNLGSFQTRAYERTAAAEISNLKSALESYRLEVGSYPSSLDALYEKPSDLSDSSKWFQVLKEPVPNDPWGNPYEYSVSGSDFELRSLGADGQSGTEDDIPKPKS